jgi:chemotaxis protein CheY-P-specific phosphatase CheC
MLELSIKELDIAKEIVNISLAKAADSLSFFIKQKVMMQISSVSLDVISSETNFTNLKTDVFTALKTEIKGDFDGNCYLLITSEDKNKILDLTLPQSVLNDEVKKKEFGREILLEIDNIVTASVVTQFSNLLKYKMYGYIPQIKEVNFDDINHYLFSENNNQSALFSVKTKFSTEKDKLEPEFIWFMNKEKFIAGVQNYKI